MRDRGRGSSGEEGLGTTGGPRGVKTGWLDSDSALSLDELLADYQSNAHLVWDRRANDVFSRWHDDRSDFPVILERLPRPLKSVLDLGCGYGRLAPLYAFAAVKVGVDISVRMLQLARSHVGQAAGFYGCAARLDALPFGDGVFQVGVAVRSLSHVHPVQVRQVLREIRRVVSDRLILIEPTAVLLDARLQFLHDYGTLLVGEGFEITEQACLDGETRMICAHTRSRD